MSLYSQSGDSIPSSSKIKSYIHYLGVEVGTKSFNPGYQEFDFIRQGPSSFPYYNNNYGSNYGEITFTSFISVIAEYRFPSDRFWLSTGIKYASMNSTLGYGEGGGSQTDFFYIMLNKDQNNTYYYRINEISEHNQYIGVPLDFSYSPFLPRFFRLYFKIGFDFNFKIATKQSVDFEDSGMKNHEKEITKLFGRPDNFYATTTLGIGVQFGRQNKPNVRIEGNFPSFVLTSENSGLVKHSFGGGGRISLLIPLKN